MSKNKNTKAKKEIICFCNSITKECVEKAIATGNIDNADQLYDATGAGVGACGGTCRANTIPIIEYFKKHKVLPTK